MSVREIEGSEDDYNRLAEPDWIDPLNADYCGRVGGRWNPPGQRALYLNRGVRMARLQVMHKIADHPYDPEDLDPDEQHHLVMVTVPRCRPLDCVSAEGVADAGLPATYPKDATGATVGHDVCQPIGAEAAAEGLDGVACRSAARDATPQDEELALFDGAAERVEPVARLPFADWFF